MNGSQRQHCLLLPLTPDEFISHSRLFPVIRPEFDSFLDKNYLQLTRDVSCNKPIGPYRPISCCDYNTHKENLVCICNVFRRNLFFPSIRHVWPNVNAQGDRLSLSLRPLLSGCVLSWNANLSSSVVKNNNIIK